MRSLLSVIIPCPISSRILRALLPAILALSLPAGLMSAGEQLPNLDEEKPAPRFPVPDIVWPENPGDAEICFWKDDKIAPVCFTVDDNTAPDVPWWLEIADRYGIKVTWFIISGNVGGRGWGGTWPLWAEVLAKGHDVQSHTHTHLNADSPEWQGIDWEYAESKRLIEANLPGHRVRFLAYPGGKHSSKNDRAVAAKYYAGARGVTGTLVSPAQMDYMESRAIIEAAFGNPGSPWADMHRVLDRKDKVFRAWSIYIYHSVKDKTFERPLFQFLAENRDKFWVGLYGEISLYAQERDTATLSVTERSPHQITFELTDRMKDEDFDYSLTLKVRLPDGWKGVAARQNGNPVESRFVEYGGRPYALVQSTPDRGPVVVTEK